MHGRHGRTELSLAAAAAAIATLASLASLRGFDDGPLGDTQPVLDPIWSGLLVACLGLMALTRLVALRRRAR
jgi:hypothetical protein